MKRLLQILSVLICSLQTFSQTVTSPAYAHIDSNHRTYVNQVFGLLEPNRVSAGLLVDYDFDFTNPKIYNGSVILENNSLKFDN